MQHRLAFALALLAAAVTGPHDGVRAPAPPPERPQSWADAPGPKVGSAIPPFELPDQDGRMRTFASLKGRGGLVLNFNRSVVW